MFPKSFGLTSGIHLVESPEKQFCKRGDENLQGEGRTFYFHIPFPQVQSLLAWWVIFSLTTVTLEDNKIPRKRPQRFAFCSSFKNANPGLVQPTLKAEVHLLKKVQTDSRVPFTTTQ